jgi:hypothetical protein
MPDAASKNVEALNADTIAAIAEETRQPLPVVKEVYEEQYARLKAQARICDYLVLFATRRTKDALARRRAGHVKPHGDAKRSDPSGRKLHGLMEFSAGD